MPPIKFTLFLIKNPKYGIFKVSKPKCVSLSRQIWNYDQGSYDLLHNNAVRLNLLTGIKLGTMISMYTP